MGTLLCSLQEPEGEECSVPITMRCKRWRAWEGPQAVLGGQLLLQGNVRQLWRQLASWHELLRLQLLLFLHHHHSSLFINLERVMRLAPAPVPSIVQQSR